MTTISLHLLHSLPASLINRDDGGHAKSITVGNTRRDRVSSQSWKRAIRENLRTDPALQDATWASRTKNLPRLVLQNLADDPTDEQKTAVAALFTGMGFKLDDKLRTKAGIFAAENAAEQLATIIKENPDLETGEAPAKNLVAQAHAALSAQGAIDLALFGRMLAELAVGGRIDGAAGVSHAFGITPATEEPDFFTTLDDTPLVGDSVAIDLVETSLTAPIFYRHVYLDVDQLTHNLGDTTDLTNQAVAAFIRSTVTAVPQAKQRNTAAVTLPDLAVAVVGTGTYSAANAFTKAITSTDALSEGATALLDQIVTITAVTGGNVTVLPLSATAREAVGDRFTTVDNLDAFITATTKAES